MPDHVVAVSESGLRSRAELDRLAAAGYRAFLIGERFMTDPDPARAIRELIGPYVRAASNRLDQGGPAESGPYIRGGRL
jgi:indole-3-glycerol phosphate synthase